MSDGIDATGLSDFTTRMLKLASKQMPKETKKFLQKEGNKLKRKTTKKAKGAVKNQTGKYLAGIKRGKVYQYQDEGSSIRVYNSAPHAHLVEKGHRQVSKNGVESGFVKGQKIFENTGQQFETEFYKDCENFIDDLLDKGLG